MGQARVNKLNGKVNPTGQDIMKKKFSVLAFLHNKVTGNLSQMLFKIGRLVEPTIDQSKLAYVIAGEDWTDAEERMLLTKAISMFIAYEKDVLTVANMFDEPGVEIHFTNHGNDRYSCDRVFTGSAEAINKRATDYQKNPTNNRLPSSEFDVVVVA